MKFVNLIAFYEDNRNEIEARWLSKGASNFLCTFPLSILTGFCYAVLVDSDGERRFAIEATLRGKDIERSEDGVLRIVEKVKFVEKDDGSVIDLSELPPGFFDAGDSIISDDMLRMLGR